MMSGLFFAGTCKNIENLPLRGDGKMRGGERDNSIETYLDTAVVVNQESDDEKIIPKAEKGHQILYWKFAVIYVVSLFFAAIFWRSAEASSEVVNVISIGAGLMSIGLAFGAMIYAYSQTKVATEQNSQVQRSLQEIRDHVIYFSTIREEFSNFRSDFTTAMTQLNQFNKESLQNYDQMKKELSGINEVKEKLLKSGDNATAQELGEKLNQAIKKAEELKGKSFDTSKFISAQIDGGLQCLKNNILIEKSTDKIVKARKKFSLVIEIQVKKDIAEVMEYIEASLQAVQELKFDRIINRECSDIGTYEVLIAGNHINVNSFKNITPAARITRALNIDNDFYELLDMRNLR